MEMAKRGADSGGSGLFQVQQDLGELHRLLKKRGLHSVDWQDLVAAIAAGVSRLYAGPVRLKMVVEQEP